VTDEQFWLREPAADIPAGREQGLDRLRGYSDEALGDLADQAYDRGDHELAGDISEVLGERGPYAGQRGEIEGEAEL
jgi:hypothetical protein